METSMCDCPVKLLGFHLAWLCWDTCLWSPEVFCEESSHTEAPVLEGKREMLKELSCWSLPSPGAGHLVSEPSDDFSLQLLILPIEALDKVHQA